MTKRSLYNTILVILQKVKLRRAPVNHPLNVSYDTACPEATLNWTQGPFLAAPIQSSS